MVEYPADMYEFSLAGRINVFSDAASLSILSVPLFDPNNPKPVLSPQPVGGPGPDYIQGGSMTIDYLRGEGGDDFLDDSSDIYRNTLDGGPGNDILHGGSGSDNLIGGDGFDFAFYTGQQYDGIFVQLWNGWARHEYLLVSPEIRQVDSLENIEGIVGTPNNDWIGGDNGPNVLLGDRGNDILYGFGNVDFIAGGEGEDTMVGGPGSDFIKGGSGDDMSVYHRAISDYEITRFGDQVAVSDKYAYSEYDNDGIDVLINVEYLDFEGTRWQVPTGQFRALSYICSYGDLIEAFGANPQAAFQHYITTGIYEGRSVTFNGFQYIASYGDLIGAFGANEEAGASHYIVAGRVEGRATDLFDEEQYLANYSDLQAAFGNDTEAAILHYITFGHDEGRTDDMALLL